MIKLMAMVFYMHVNGAKYEGTMEKMIFKMVYGIETWADGSRYEGYYKEGKKTWRW